jgi:hypothetical protein
VVVVVYWVVVAVGCEVEFDVGFEEEPVTVTPPVDVEVLPVIGRLFVMVPSVGKDGRFERRVGDDEGALVTSAVIALSGLVNEDVRLLTVEEGSVSAPARVLAVLPGALVALGTRLDSACPSPPAPLKPVKVCPIVPATPLPAAAPVKPEIA